jgi:hypothetical protein
MYEDYIVVIFRRIHTANIRGNTKSEDDYLAAGTWPSGIFRRPG